MSELEDDELSEASKVERDYHDLLFRLLTLAAILLVIGLIYA